MSGLSNVSKKVNWRRLRVKGAVLALQEAAESLNITHDELISLNKAIVKIETLVLNKLAEDYEAFKATELYARQLANLHETTKIILAEIDEHKRSGFNNIASRFIYHKHKRQVAKELTLLGYQVKELKVGNTFLITWAG